MMFYKVFRLHSYLNGQEIEDQFLENLMNQGWKILRCDFNARTDELVYILKLNC